MRVNAATGEAYLSSMLAQVRIALGEQDRRRCAENKGHKHRRRHGRAIKNLEHIVAVCDFA